MKIALRVLVVLLLILSGVALFFGIVLFGQREQLKARTNMLEDSLVNVAASIETEQASDLSQRHLATGGLGKPELKRYYKLDPTGKLEKRINPTTNKKVKISDGPGTMKASLNAFEQRVRDQYQVLDDTRVDLKDTRDKLAETLDKLTRSKADVAQLNTKIDELRDENGDLKNEITSLNVTIDTKDEQIGELNNDVQQAEEKVVKLQEKQSDMQSHIAAQDKHITELTEEIERLKEQRLSIAPTVTSGYKGKIVQVNAQWNFVVIATEPDSKLARGVELVVQRGKELIGKVRITKIKTEEDMAVAEIMTEWLQKPIQQGDLVVYQR